MNLHHMAVFEIIVAFWRFFGWIAVCLLLDLPRYATRNPIDSVFTTGLPCAR
jgi:hypothetical protein